MHGTSHVGDIISSWKSSSTFVFYGVGGEYPESQDLWISNGGSSLGNDVELAR
jgi:hypothetical protein